MDDILIVLTIDDFLKLPQWNETVSPAQKSIEKPDAKIAKSIEKKEKWARVKVQLKRAEEGTNPKPLNKTTTSHLNDTTRNVAAVLWLTNAEKEVVDLSKNTRIPTPPVNTIQPSAHVENGDTQENVDAHSFHSGRDEENDEDTVAHRFVPDLGLYNDLRICSFRACKELVSHLATPAEDEFLSGLSNVEVVRRAYHLLGRGVLAQEELSRLRNDLQREMQGNDGLSKKLALLESVHSSCPDRERELMNNLKDMEKKRDVWRQTVSDQEERIKKLEEVIEPKSKQLTDVEGRIRVLENEKTALVA
ncbi:hypothetical protein Tco_1054643 [Tanacetum coccineum]|uniref:Uncharacterized protein n=1 Tax=Tanacetum coccineum TaxID=301880 RepID=A0ABQ5GXE5_9ASTR